MSHLHFMKTIKPICWRILYKILHKLLCNSNQFYIWEVLLFISRASLNIYRDENRKLNIENHLPRLYCNGLRRNRSIVALLPIRNANAILYTRDYGFSTSYFSRQEKFDLANARPASLSPLIFRSKISPASLDVAARRNKISSTQATSDESSLSQLSFRGLYFNFPVSRISCTVRGTTTRRRTRKREKEKEKIRDGPRLSISRVFVCLSISRSANSRFSRNME